MADAIAFPVAEAWPRAALLNAARFHTIAHFLVELDAASFPDHAVLNRLAAPYNLCSGGGAPLCFVPPRADANYERTVHDTGAVPTRANHWHDLFNALAWCAFPRAKALINRLHIAELAKQQSDAMRSSSRDVLTLFDESGMVIACANTELAQLLRSFRWKELFWHRREDVRRAMRFHIFGHALHEQLLNPYRGITAKAVIIEVNEGFFNCGAREQLAFLDEAVCTYFEQPQALATTRTFQPVPVLGIPDWWPANEDASYYDDTQHFRPGRALKKQSPARRRSAEQGPL